MAFWWAINSHIKAHKDFFGWDVKPEYLSRHYDLLIFPAANQLNSFWDMGHLADIFDKANLPMIVVGLGVQANSLNENINLMEGTKKLIKIFGERCLYIGVRGKRSAELLSEHHITNVEILGCPSNFLNEKSNLGRSHETQINAMRDGKDINKIILNTDISNQFSGLLPTFVSWCAGKHMSIVNQSPLELIQLSRNDCGDQNNLIEILESTKPLFMSLASENEFQKFAARTFISFFSAPAWMDYSRSFDFSLGTRIHGNMLAWQSGVPTIFITHDARSIELVDTMQVPYVSINDFDDNQSLHDFIEKNLDFDGRNYDINRKELLEKYIRLFEHQGVPVNDYLNNINKL